jgi:hypothetical protein
VEKLVAKVLDYIAGFGGTPSKGLKIRNILLPTFRRIYFSFSYFNKSKSYLRPQYRYADHAPTCKMENFVLVLKIKV